MWVHCAEQKCCQLFSRFISLLCSLLSSSFVITGVKRERLKQVRMSWRGRQSKWLDLVIQACSQQLFKWEPLGFWGQALHTLPCAHSTWCLCMLWKLDAAIVFPGHTAVALKITTMCSEGFTPVRGAKLSTKTEEHNTPDLSVLPLRVLGSLPRVSGLSLPHWIHDTSSLKGYLSAGHNVSVLLGTSLLQSRQAPHLGL